ncbi:helix-turn-helix domain-containing protein [Pontibacter sp. MBLB2868]|uniref:helix-turn-helix domain-containing protein n=1 Tax=Pontibacter sp. MBLB2868 TaxID=3451555 RepID=UPI003F7571A1
MEIEILVKGMVCNRCIAVLQKELENRGIAVQEVTLGKVLLQHPLDESVTQEIQEILSKLGFELLIDRQTRLLCQIKEIVEAELRQMEEKKKLSSVLTDKLNTCYSSLNEAFVQTEGITIDQYFIQRRLDKVKELLKYSDLTFTDIAFQTGFSSVHYLSKHFKDHTDLTPSQFRYELKANPVTTLPAKV